MDLFTIHIYTYAVPAAMKISWEFLRGDFMVFAEISLHMTRSCADEGTCNTKQNWEIACAA